MTEVLFILMAVFVAYVIYRVVSEHKTPPPSPVSQAEPEKPVAAVKPSTPRSAPKKKKVAAVKAVASTASQPEPATASQDTGKRGLKDPKSGEVATTYSNYRFTKRWIKEALVAEGLMDKVYKNAELNAEIEATIKSAILKLEANDKYRV
jgi:outer membrane biosynthesis protein TonB